MDNPNYQKLIEEGIENGVPVADILKDIEKVLPRIKSRRVALSLERTGSVRLESLLPPIIRLTAELLLLLKSWLVFALVSL